MAPTEMRPHRTSRTGLAPWVTALVAALMIVRGLIPAGYMPDFRDPEAGGFRVVICSAWASRTITIDLPDASAPPHGADSHGTETDRCPCAVAATVVFAPPNGAILGPVFRSAQADIPVSSNTAVSLVSAGPLGPRAPPVS